LSRLLEIVSYFPRHRQKNMLIYESKWEVLPVTVTLFIENFE